MAFRFNDEILQLLQSLVSKITKFDEDSDIYQHTYKYVVQQLQQADSLFFVTQREIDSKITGLSDKFIFHGFLKHAGDLTRIYEKFIGKSTPKDELRNRLNVIQLLFCLSENPTGYLATLPLDYQSYTIEKEEEVDWGSYLWEGIERWSPPPNTDSDEWTDEESDTLACVDEAASDSISNTLMISSKPSIASVEVFNYRSSLEKITKCIQTGWFNDDYVCMLPNSTNVDATVAIRWEEHLENMTSGLVKINKSKVISEYKIIREILWQFRESHNGTAFKFSRNDLVPRDNITIASCRPAAFKVFLNVFLPYIKMLQDFQAFEDLVLVVGTKDFHCYPPYTYRSYCTSVQNILRPVMKSLVELETKVLDQEETMTLLKLASICQSTFKLVKILSDIHTNVIIDLNKNSRLLCATNLLSKLHEGLLCPETKVAQDIYLCLYLESLHTYMCIIDNWLSKGVFQDDCNEFPILDESSVNCEDWQMEFKLQHLDGNVSESGLFKIISKNVLQIGKNLHLLGILGKLHLVNETNSPKEPLYEELIERVLADVTHHFGNSPGNVEANNADEGIDTESFKFPIICSDFCKYPTEMDKVDSLVDTNDVFLMKAFESFFVDIKAKDSNPVDDTLYSRISKITTNIFPAHHLIERVFTEILKDRYSGSGRTVKNLLRYDYQLDDHLEALKHVFLFKDDIIFPFYRKLFQKSETVDKSCNIDITAHLQSIIMDFHPNLYDKLTVTAKESWTDFIEDPLKSSSLFKVNFKVAWPVSIIIKTSHMRLYHELFFFVFQIKWGLYMLNQLQFKDIEVKIRHKKINRPTEIAQMRLKILRFGLVNLFSLIQHYILGYAFNKCSIEFEENYNNSHDLDTLIHSHHTFITDLHQHLTFLRDYNERNFGFYLLLFLVRKLYHVWKNPKEIDIRKLDSYERNYKECYNKLMPVLSPTKHI